MYYSFFKLTPQKMRAKSLAEAELELESRIQQQEQIDMLVRYLRKKVERLKVEVAADDLSARKAVVVARYTGSQTPPSRPPK